MKRHRRMLLCVTATSMAAVVGCKEPEVRPVGIVGEPPTPASAGPMPSEDARVPVDDAGPQLAQHADASSSSSRGPSDAAVTTHVIGRSPHLPTDVVQVRVGTTAEAPEDFTPAPTVGTTAHVPDRARK